MSEAVSVRPATAQEIVAVYAGDARHVAGTVAGRTVAVIGFTRVEGRLWGIYHVMDDVGETAPSGWARLFYAFRRELRAHAEPVRVLARDRAAGRVLRLLGLRPAGETYVGKDVWIWTPPPSS
jgi:hypothetical protein